MFFAELGLMRRGIATVHPQLCRQYIARFPFWLIFCVEIGIYIVFAASRLARLGVGWVVRAWGAS